MGLIKAFTTSVSSSLGDQFKEYVTCPSMESGVLIQKGEVHHGKGNKNPSEDVITNGSLIMVPEQCAMMIVENGKIIEFSAESGGFTFESGSEPSIFTGGLGKGIIDSIKQMGKRTTFGGQTAQNQKVYYINLLTFTNNKFGSVQPKKITDDKYGMLEVTFFGEYGLKVEDPTLLVQNFIGSNSVDKITYKDLFEGQFKSKFVEKLTQAITIVMRKHKIPFGDIGMYGTDISDEMNNLLKEDLLNKYGMKITDVVIADINVTDDSMARINKIDDATIFSNQNLQSGLMADATATALKNAASNEGGAMVGFMGMSMANQTGANIMGTVNQNTTPLTPDNKQTPDPGTLFKKEEEASPNFCPNCGKKIADSNFCGNCGAKLK